MKATIMENARNKKKSQENNKKRVQRSKDKKKKTKKEEVKMRIKQICQEKKRLQLQLKTMNKAKKK